MQNTWACNFYTDIFGILDCLFTLPAHRLRHQANTDAVPLVRFILYSIHIVFVSFSRTVCTCAIGIQNIAKYGSDHWAWFVYWKHPIIGRSDILSAFVRSVAFFRIYVSCLTRSHSYLVRIDSVSDRLSTGRNDLILGLTNNQIQGGSHLDGCSYVFIWLSLPIHCTVEAQDLQPVKSLIPSVLLTWTLIHR